ncbi:MAG TPA: LacI family DNA-binding transcriptional regulator [Thermoanaerobaculia bacterium]|nr:LacI family DNA-binding transcriptional regulator [Thermoanaerobaculia bacterium]
MRANQAHLRRARGRTGAAAATIRDVAARAGVSVATVSRVLNGKELVREETSAQVLEAARILHYVPNVAARSLSIRRTQTIGVVLPEMHGQFFSEVIRGIDVAARREGYHILVSGSHSDAAEMMDVVHAMRGRVDGLVVMAPDVEVDSLGSQLPLVLLNSSDRRHAAITIDNFGGARSMMRHLTSLGHTRIAFITGPAQNADARERLRGYRHSMRGSNAAAVEVRGDFSEESGHAAADEIAKTHRPPTAIFAANDSMAIGALSALSGAGWRVPEDITVVGFDDIPIARYVSPQLTTIRVDIAELGRRAFAVLLDALSRPSGAGEPRRERITTNLIVRRSCAAPATSRSGKRAKGEKS